MVLSPAPFFAIGLHRHIEFEQLPDLINEYLLVVLFQLVFSLLTWLIFWMVIELIVGNIERLVLRKFLISIIGVGLTFATFRLIPFFDGSNYNGFGALVLSNCVFIALGSWHFKITDKEESSE